MRKTLFIAFAFVASVLAFTSCNKKDANTPDEPTVENPLVGTWFTSDVENDYFYTFSSDGKYQRILDYYMNGRAVVAHEHIVADGTYQSDKDILTANIDSIRIYMDGSKDSGPFDDFWPAQEKIQFKIEGDKLTLTHEYESGDAWTEVLTKNGKPADQDDPSDINKEYFEGYWHLDSMANAGSRPIDVTLVNDTLLSVNADYYKEPQYYKWSHKDGKINAPWIWSQPLQYVDYSVVSVDNAKAVLKKETDGMLLYFTHILVVHDQAD